MREIVARSSTLLPLPKQGIPNLGLVSTERDGSILQRAFAAVRVNHLWERRLADSVIGWSTNADIVWRDGSILHSKVV